MSTIREHLEAIINPNAKHTNNSNGEKLHASIRHAEAALKLLDESEPFKLSIEGQVHAPMRAVYDPKWPA